MERINDCLLTLKNKYNIPVNICANSQVKIEKNAVQELLQLLELAENIRNIDKEDNNFFDITPQIEQVAITPDFHKGRGVPIGTVMKTTGFVSPQAIGKDVNCGIRFYTTDLSPQKIADCFTQLSQKIRHVFFEGGRQIPMTRVQRESLFKEGLLGVLNTHTMANDKGIWKYYCANKQEIELNRVNDNGSFITDDIFALQDFLGRKELNYDDQIGSIGGGNHFVEVQKVKKICDNKTAYQWGIKKDQVVVMIHTGCVSIGYPTGNFFGQIAQEIYPSSLAQPQNKIFVLPQSEKYQKYWNCFWASLYNAANFAFANRLFLGLMLEKCIHEVIGDVNFDLVYDTGHNIVHEENGSYIHRKGANPARSAAEMNNTPFEYYGEPVMIPGSMGSSSFLMCGKGRELFLSSASHGAGRSLSRGQAIRHDKQKFRAFMEKFKIITPIDPQRLDLKSRPDIIKKWEEEIKKEAPYAYKDISAVIDSQVQGNIVGTVAELEPIFTIKG
ncbi:RtcB family protein [Candidatus Uabimicrobium sp. HlEnr_7]|uniref:RtcB family protein n=1 Tax=Candidatus Uabimicrobium helgolandensis TaxID=3095367 RepID=UPI003557605F